VPSLTHAEAVERARLLTITAYDVRLDLTSATADDETGETFASRAVVRFASAEPGATSFADLKARRVRSITLNGAPLDPSTVTDGRLPLPGLAASNELVVEADMAFSRDGQGLHRAVDPADGLRYVFGHLFLDAAPRVFACFDQPDLKAPYDVRVRAPQGWLVVGNGASGPAPDADGWWTLATTRPLSTYFVTVCAGPYAAHRDEHRGIPLGIYARASMADLLAAQAPEILRITKAGLDYYEELFGIAYPFGGYDQVFVPEFNAGAMENPGCVVLRDQMIFRGTVGDAERMGRVNTVLHEMAHMWFGDLVTMRWWDDLWLNESFAEYMAHRSAAAVSPLGSPWADFTMARKTWGYAAERSPSTHPVAGNPPADAAAALQNFDGISYAKGASVLAQLVAYLGDEGFLAGVRDHLESHAFGNASLADFLAAMERATGRELGPWSDAWLRTAGLDEIAVDLRSDGARVSAADVRRVAPAGGDAAGRPDSWGPADRPHAFQIAGYDDGREVWRRDVLLDDEEIELDGVVGAPVPHLVIPDAGSATWATIRLSARSLAALPTELPRVPDPVARAVVWAALLDGLHDATVDPRTVLGLAEAALPVETDPALLHGITTTVLRPLVRVFLSAAERVIAEPRLAEVARALTASREVGSSAYVVGARARARWETDAAYLRGVMVGDTEVEPLAGDADLRWLATTTLAERGLIDLATLDRRHEQDRTLAGGLAYLTARAALPGPQSKAWAWRQLTHEDGLSNYERNALATGFWMARDPAALRDYVARYFVDVPALGDRLGEDALARVAAFAFPAVLVEEATADAARVALSGGGLSEAVRREVVDGLAELEQALASRARFGA
jgi:aminopeptidase N